MREDKLSWPNTFPFLEKILQTTHRQLKRTALSLLLVASSLPTEGIAEGAERQSSNHFPWFSAMGFSRSCGVDPEGTDWVEWGQHGRYHILVRRPPINAESADAETAKFHWLIRDEGSACHLVYDGNGSISMYSLTGGGGRLGFVRVNAHDFPQLTTNESYVDLLEALLSECQDAQSELMSWPFSWGNGCNEQVEELIYRNSAVITITPSDSFENKYLFLVLNRVFIEGVFYR